MEPKGKKLSSKPSVEGGKALLVASNHYPLNLKTICVNEFHVRYIKKKDLPTLQANKEFFDNDAVDLSARELIFQIQKANRKQVQDDLGTHVFTGQTCFNFLKIEESQFIYTNHPDFCLVLKVTNKNMSSDQLVANENCRVPVLRALNSFIKEIMRKMGFREFGRLKKFYNPNEEKELNVGGVDIILLKGFKTCFEVYDSGLKLLVNFNCRIVRKKNLYQEFLDNKKNYKSEEEAADDFIIHRTVMTMYGNNRPYIIDKVEWKMKPSDKFPNKDYPNYESYFAKKYGCKIQYKDQFLLLSIVKRRNPEGELIEDKVYLLPELVRPTGLTDEMRSNRKVMQELSVETIKAPQDRFKLTDAFVTQINNVSKKSSQNIQLTIKEGQGMVNAIQAELPKIKGFNSNFNIKNDRIDVGQIAEPFKVEKWVMVYEQFIEQSSYTVIDNFKKACKRYNIAFDEADDYVVTDKFPTAEKIMQSIEKCKCKNPQLVFFFFSKKTASNKLYSTIKKNFDAKGIVTQFFVNFNPNKDATGLAKFSNLLLQMAVKSKKNLWFVETAMKDTLVLGADVAHGGKDRSVAAVVGLWGPNLANTYSECQIQKKGQEVMKGVADMVLKNVAHYAQKNKIPPKNVIFYRDGVGEGQVSEVAKVEVDSIKKALEKAYPTNTPKLMFIIVTKRLDDRFATAYNGYENPNSGLIINKDVVMKDKYHFFMVSQKVTQGTATPTSYEVVLDEVKMDENLFYSFTFHQTYNYHNWMGAVKVPAAVQYAHKLCGEKAITMDTNVPNLFKEQKYYM